MSDPTVLFNAECSKCRTAQSILAERGVAANYVHYMTATPPRAELERIMGLLGIDHPRGMARTSEPVWSELGLENASADEVLDAMVEHPVLIERPIVIVGDRAVIARPPERLLEILDDPA
jgi:arsenate reductase (glutaredoxin)